MNTGQTIKELLDSHHIRATEQDPSTPGHSAVWIFPAWTSPFNLKQLKLRSELKVQDPWWTERCRVSSKASSARWPAIIWASSGGLLFANEHPAPVHVTWPQRSHVALTLLTWLWIAGCCFCLQGFKLNYGWNGGGGPATPPLPTLDPSRYSESQ